MQYAHQRRRTAYLGQHVAYAARVGCGQTGPSDQDGEQGLSRISRDLHRPRLVRVPGQPAPQDLGGLAERGSAATGGVVGRRPGPPAQRLDERDAAERISSGHGQRLPEQLIGALQVTVPEPLYAGVLRHQ